MSNRKQPIRVLVRPSIVWPMLLLSVVGMSLVRSAASQVAFKDVHVIPVCEPGVLRHQTVLVKEHKIESISAAETTVISNDYEVIDGAGATYLIPGMMNAHAHIPGPQGLDMPLQDYLLMQVAAGVTSLRVMRYEPDHLSIRDQATNEGWVSPHLYLTAPAIHKRNGIDYESPGKLFEEYKKLGYDHIKYLNGLDPASHELLVVAAGRVGLPFAGHLPPHIELANALKIRQSGIEHFHGYTKLLSDGKQSELASLIEETKRQKLFNCPTADWYRVQNLEFQDATTLLERKGLEYLPEPVVSSWTDWLETKMKTNSESDRVNETVLKMFSASGAELLLGWDDGPFIIPGFGLAHEAEAFATAGFSNTEILRFATLSGAAFYGATNEFGSLKPGLRADAALLKSNPLESLKALEEIAGVLVNGQWHSENVLKEKLSKVVQRIAQPGAASK